MHRHVKLAPGHGVSPLVSSPLYPLIDVRAGGRDDLLGCRSVEIHFGLPMFLSVDS